MIVRSRTPEELAQGHPQAIGEYIREDGDSCSIDDAYGTLLDFSVYGAPYTLTILSGRILVACFDAEAWQPHAVNTVMYGACG